MSIFCENAFLKLAKSYADFSSNHWKVNLFYAQLYSLFYCLLLEEYFCLISAYMLQ